MRKHEVKSRINNRVLHVVLRAADFDPGREDVSAPTEELQLSAIYPIKGTAYRAHRHILKQGPGDHSTQEAWVVVAGQVVVDYYDSDGVLLESASLGPGDCTVSYGGGHGYKIVSDDVRVYEFKTGPYLGAAADKEYLK